MENNLSKDNEPSSAQLTDAYENLTRGSIAKSIQNVLDNMLKEKNLSLAIDIVTGEINPTGLNKAFLDIPIFPLLFMCERAQSETLDTALRYCILYRLIFAAHEFSRYVAKYYTEKDPEFTKESTDKLKFIIDMVTPIFAIEEFMLTPNATVFSQNEKVLYDGKKPKEGILMRNYFEIKNFLAK